VGLDQGPQFTSSRIFALTLSILFFTLSMVLDFLVIREIFFPSKVGPNPGPPQGEWMALWDLDVSELGRGEKRE
jgi:hypothetical protein